MPSATTKSPNNNRMSRAAVAVASLLACAMIVPAVAEAAPRRIPRISLRYNAAKSYERWVNSLLVSSIDRIETKVAATRGTNDAQIMNDVHVGASTLRQRVENFAGDGSITAAEKQQLTALNLAVQAELSRLHGDLDSWLLL